MSSQSLNSPKFPNSLARATQHLAIRGLQNAGEFCNIVFSPYAVGLGLVTLFPFADKANKAQIARLMGLTEKVENAVAFLRLWKEINQRKGMQCLLGNRIWLASGVSQDPLAARLLSALPDVTGTMQYGPRYYQTSDTIESWYRERFGAMYEGYGPIAREDDLSSQPSLLFTSSMPVMGGWQYPFHRHLIRNGLFKTNGGQGFEIPFMQRGASYNSRVSPDCKILEIDFASDEAFGNLGMVIWAPRYESLAKFKRRMSVEYYQDAIRQMFPIEQAFHMPLFDIRSTFSHESLFGSQYKVGIIAGQGSLHGKLLHHAAIKVNDAGIGPSPKSMPANECKDPSVLPFSIFFFDAPFFFFVRDRDTGVVLLAGQYALPDVGQNGPR